jgi:site-specific DNA recombinase
MHMTVAMYARVSSDRQKEEQTIGSQLQELYALASKEGLTVDERHVYIDDGQSGYYLDRPALDRLRDAARDGLIDILLVLDPDRLSRKYAYQVLLLEEFKRWEVQIRFLRQPPADNPEQQLLVQIQGVIAEYERARIMERTRRGRLYWARQGRAVSPRVPYGYTYIPRNKKDPSSVEIDPEAAEVVRQIFDWYAHEGLSAYQISTHLTNRKVPPPRRTACHWAPSSVRFILMNEAYLGIWYLNHYRKEPRAGHIRPRTVKRSRDEWIGVTIPSLIGCDVFLRAQEIRDSGCHQGPQPLRYPETHLLRRLVVCGSCNRKMTSTNNNPDSYRYYWCRGTDSHHIEPARSWCPHPTISAPELDALVWSDVVSLLGDPALVLSAWREQNMIDHREDLSAEEVERLQRQMYDAKKQKARILDAYEKGVIELEELVSRRSTIEKKIEVIGMKLETVSAQTKEELSRGKLQENIDEVCHMLCRELGLMNMNRKMQLCRDLIEKVVVEKQNVEIHYKFPVSSNFNKKRERHVVLPLKLLLSIGPPL